MRDPTLPKSGALKLTTYFKWKPPPLHWELAEAFVVQYFMMEMRLSVETRGIECKIPKPVHLFRCQATLIYHI